MDWESPKVLWLAVPAVALLLWIESRSEHPMEGVRKRLLLMVRAVGVLLLLLALAGPARVAESTRRAVVLVVDQSQSMGSEGVAEVMKRAEGLRGSVSGVDWQMVALGDAPSLLSDGESGAGQDRMLRHGAQSDYGAAVKFASGLFPAGTTRDVILVGDGHETRGSLTDVAYQAAAAGITIHAMPISGVRRPDVRVRDLTPSRTRLHEGAALKLTASIDSTMDGSGVVRLFENGLEVAKRELSLKAGESREVVFDRSPNERNVFRYRVAVEGFSGDVMPGNDSALAIVDVRGRLRLLYAEGEPGEASYLKEAMEKEGIQLDLRGPGQVPSTVADLNGYDGIILSDIAARSVGDAAMMAIKEYVEKLGGGLVMVGGPNSFGVGGYYKSPLDEVLPVRLRAPDEEEKQSSALAIVLDRSGSMAGEKLETAKSAAVAAAEVLGRNDSIGVYAFDSEAHVVAQMTRVTSLTAVRGQIAALASGGGTNLEPALRQAREALLRVKAKIKHMIILTDGQTSGTGYEVLAAQCRAEGITISTVAIGEGSHVGLLQAIASAGGGQSYLTSDVATITRIFTQDTLMHTGQMLREEPTEAKVVEKSPMLEGLEPWDAPALLGYVKTIRKASAQLPLMTDTGDPLLANWRYGLGKVTAFTSDVKSRWASLWISRWSGFGAFWGQLLRETARAPQGQEMDIRTRMVGDEAEVVVDVLADAGTRANGVNVMAEVFHVAAETLGVPLRSVKKMSLRQDGPGEYVGTFRPDQPGVYLVQAQSGTDMVSTGLVHQPSGEASLGTVNTALLEKVTAATGGKVLGATDGLPPAKVGSAREYVELWPTLLKLFLLLWMADVAIRRWEHVLGLFGRMAGRA